MFQYILNIFFCLLMQTAQAQQDNVKKVIDIDTHEPIIGAIVYDNTTNKPITITNSDGRFSIPKNNYNQLRITCIGYKTIVVPSTSETFQMQAEISLIGEVVVTAQESKSAASSSIIQRHAMEHLQPSSFTDLLELLPGNISKDPDLDAPNIIHIREIPISNADYATSALGTSFIIDGAPISTNANMQYIAGAWESEATERDYTNSGVDMRTISTDDIESVEIVRGIPSVEYGDLTSGLVKVERRRGGNAFKARIKADMSSKLFYVAKDIELLDSTTLNISADYLRSNADPRNTLENYSRLSFSARYAKNIQHNNKAYKLSANIDYGGSFDKEKQDPDLNSGKVDKFKSNYNRIAFLAKCELTNHNNIWLKNASITLSSAYQHDVATRTKTVSLQTMTGAVQTNTEGVSDLLILPYVYTASQTADGKPLNIFIKLSANIQVPSKTVANQLLIGCEWNMDKNYGDGQVFDTMRPVYPSSNIRMRSLSLKPANNTLSAYAEEKLTLPLGNSKIELMGGIRLAQMLNLPTFYAMHNTIYADPRANIRFTLPKFTIAHKPTFITLATGIGKHTKMPTIDQLFPNPVYIDLQQLKYYNINPDYSRINIITYIIDGYNPTLSPARNNKWEISADINWGGNRFNVTYFSENMKSGFRSQLTYSPYQYKKYDYSNIDEQTLTSAPDIDNMPYEIKNELCAYSHYENGSQTKKQGIEYTFSTKRLEKLCTRLTVNGAWLRTTYHNSQLIMEQPSVVIGNARLQYVGLYSNDDGVIYELSNTNFMFDTDIPTLKLGFSVSAQCQWYSSSQRMPLSNYPDAYMDSDGNIHEWTAECAADTYLKELIRNNSEALYKRYKVPFAMFLNLKVTKKLLDEKLNIAMFCNRIWNHAPSYESNSITVRRHYDPYFGIELNFKI